MNLPDRYLSVAECASLLGVEHKTVRRLIERGALPALRVGRVLRIDPADLARLRVPVVAAAAPRRRVRTRPVAGEFARRARAERP